MLEKIKKWFSKEEPKVEVKPEEPKKPKKPKIELSAKDKATAAGEPYVNVISMEVDPTDINSGAFELDWNDKFLLNLIKQGYKIRPDDTDNEIVDRWFRDLARNMLAEEGLDANRGAGYINVTKLAGGKAQIE